MSVSVSTGMNRVPLGGAFLFGVVCDLFLFGVLTSQMYIYSISFQDDRLILVLAAILVYLIGATQTGLGVFNLYKVGTSTTVLGSRTGSISGDHLWYSISLSTIAVAFIVQCLYAHKIYVLSRRFWIPSLIVCLSFTQTASGLAVVVSDCLSHLEFTDPNPKVACIPVLPTELVVLLSTTSDIMISVTMVYLLRRRRNDILRRSMQRRVARLIWIILETGLVTSITAICFVLGYALGIGAAVPGFAIGKIYSNTMLALLNNRITIIGGRNQSECLDTQSSFGWTSRIVDSPTEHSVFIYPGSINQSP